MRKVTKYRTLSNRELVNIAQKTVDNLNEVLEILKSDHEHVDALIEIVQRFVEQHGN